MKSYFDEPESIYAISCIESFFRYHGPDFSRQDMETLIYYAAHNKYYKRKSPYNLVLFAADLRKLISSCLVLEGQYGMQLFEIKPDEQGMPDLERRAEFMAYTSGSSWIHLPHNLSVAQYLNPVKAFRQLKKYKSKDEWMTIVDELVEYALIKTSIQESTPPYHLLKVRKILLRLIEAAYLVYVRYRTNEEPMNDLGTGDDLETGDLTEEAVKV